ncbi:Hsp27 [Drosophila busckii]|uniref:Hsp27 n=1 Tax=Drosophila busckii TaxID=30019 RepID=A0A0M4EGE5_DROBS|nr:heat shock protein 27 [Drosophila busckii]ALC43477.1 Hsp27 [Drosophila busckii]
MSIVPLLNLARELDYAYNDWDHLLDDDFGFGVHAQELFHRPRIMMPQLMHRRRHSFAPYERNHHHHQLVPARRRGTLGQSSLLPAVGKDGFQVCMDVAQFKPSELTVKVVDNTIVVEGKHEEREDGHGLVQRHFVRKYTLPKDYDGNDVVSTVSSDGVLTLKAPPPPNKEQPQKERIVQIQHTGPAHLSVKAPDGSTIADAKNKSENGAGEKMETGK